MALNDVEKSLNGNAIAKFGEWVSVQDHLPEEDAKVLTWVTGRWPEMCVNERWNGYWASRNSVVTHWMPLPLPPSAQADKSPVNAEAK